MLTTILLLAAALGDEAAAVSALEAFKKAPGPKDPGARAAAVAELAKTDHPKVAAKLGAVLLGDVPEARVAAARGFALQLEDRKKSVQLLLAGAVPNAKYSVILIPLVESLGILGEEAGAPEVNKHLQHENAELAKAAVEAAGRIKSPTSMDPLIKALKEADELLKPRDPNQPGFGRDPFARMDRAGTNPREQRALAREMQPLLKKALVDITAVQCQDGKDFEAWWKENKASFKPKK